MKQSIQLYLDGEIIRKLREKEVNISELTNRMLRSYVRQESADAETAALALLQRDRQELEEALRRAKEGVLRIELSIAQIDGKINKQEEVIQEVRRSERLAALMRTLNDVIITESYDIERIKDAPVLKELEKEGIPISEAWLKRQITRIELLGR